MDDGLFGKLEIYEAIRPSNRGHCMRRKIDYLGSSVSPDVVACVDAPGVSDGARGTAIAAQIISFCERVVWFTRISERLSGSGRISRFLTGVGLVSAGVFNQTEFLAHLLAGLRGEPVLAQKLLECMAVSTFAADDVGFLDIILAIDNPLVAVYVDSHVDYTITNTQGTNKFKCTMLDTAFKFRARKCVVLLMKRGATLEYLMTHVPSGPVRHTRYATPALCCIYNPGRRWFSPSGWNQMQIYDLHLEHMGAIRNFCDYVNHPGTRSRGLPVVLQRLVMEFANAYCKCISP